MRRELSEKLERLAKLRVYAAARTLGRFGRAVVERRVTNFVVTWARFRLVMLRKYREMRASTKIKAVYRRYKQRQQYGASRYAIIKIQSIVRQRIAVRRVRKLRDPYCDMSYKDIKKLYRAEVARMQEAADAKDFQVAADIEMKL